MIVRTSWEMVTYMVCACVCILYPFCIGQLQQAKDQLRIEQEKAHHLEGMLHSLVQQMCATINWYEHAYVMCLCV